MSDLPSDLVEVLSQRTRNHPERRAFTFLGDGERETDAWTYKRLDAHARVIARQLTRSCRTGDRVLLLHPPGIEQIASLFACFCAGVIAVPCQQPGARGRLPQLHAILEDAAPTLALTTAATLDRTRENARAYSGAEQLEWHATDELTGQPEQARTAPHEVAYLQYTSGSVGSPRGVIIRHENLIQNERVIQAAFGNDEQTVIVGWLPLFHDMGLVGNVLGTVFAGASAVLMPPSAFLERPERWLHAITKYRGTVSGGPNFAYDLCVDRIANSDAEGLDLSSWSIAFNGAERVRARTLSQFADKFGSAGFRESAFLPCYGLAEATLLVTGGPPNATPASLRLDPEQLAEDRVCILANSDSNDEGDENALTVVCCGTPAESHTVEIVDQATGATRSDGVGEIVVTGPSVAAGYWGHPDATEAKFFDSRRTAGRGLRTGDLGFLLEGQLYITGRSKDLIIVRGRNYYPEDFEGCARKLPRSVQPGRAAAFALEASGKEQIVLLIEIGQRKLGEDAAALATQVRDATLDCCGIAPDRVIFVRRSSLPRTSSGKVRRRACREQLVKGHLAVTYDATTPVNSRPAATTASQTAARTIAEIAQRWCETGPDDTTTTDAALVLDSLGATELRLRLEEALGVRVPLSGLLACRRISELEALVGRETPRRDDDPNREDVHKRPPSPTASANQRGLWLLQRRSPGTGAFNIAVALRWHGALATDAMARALRSLIARHDSLHLSFPASGDSPQTDDVDRPHVIAHTDSRDQQDAAIATKVADAAWSPFDLERDPLIRLATFTLADDEHVVLVVAHHSVADLSSITILVRELAALYAEEKGGPRAAMPEPTVRYADFATWQRRFLASAAGDRAWRYWRDQLAGAPDALILPFDAPRPARPAYRGDVLRFALTANESVALRALANRLRATPFALLLATWETMLYRLTGQADFVIGCPFHGRTQPRFASVVGCFVNVLPLRSDVRSDATFEEVVERKRQRIASALDHQDFPLPELIRRLAPARAPGAQPLFQVMFSLQEARDIGADLAPFMLGVEGNGLRIAGESVAAFAFDQRTTQYDLDLAFVPQGPVYHAMLRYDRALFDPNTTARLVDGYVGMIRALLARPDARIADLPILSAEDVQRISANWNTTASADPALEDRMEELFARQAAATPDHIATVDDSGHRTYRNLDRRSNQLAGLLRGLR